MERSTGATQTPGEIQISLSQVGSRFLLRVLDNGVGMSRGVVRKHLVSVGSDFWNSVAFYSDFRAALDAGFRPIGKFGIGFFSVFMLGDHVEVETEARGNKRIKLTLDGVGRRGELRETTLTGNIGTEVRIALKGDSKVLVRNLVDIIRARAPMLNIPVVVSVTKNGSTESHRIEPGWWKRISSNDLISFVGAWRAVAHSGEPADNLGRTPQDWPIYAHQYFGSVNFGGKFSVTGWPGPKPEHIDSSKRLLSLGGEHSYGVVRCSQGIAIDRLPVPDVTGVLELGAVELTVSRDQVTDSTDSSGKARRAEESAMVQRVLEDLRPSVISRIDEIHAHGMLPGRIEFLRALASIFGCEVLDQTKLKWIPLTIPPGDLIHRARSEFLDTLRHYQRVLLAFGASPAGAYSVAARQIPAAELGSMLVVAIRKEETDVRYEIKNKLDYDGFAGVLHGTLERVLEEAKQTEDILVLAKFLLACVAQAWSMPIETLRSQSWHLEYKDEILWADLRKI